MTMATAAIAQHASSWLHTPAVHNEHSAPMTRTTAAAASARTVATARLASARPPTQLSMHTTRPSMAAYVLYTPQGPRPLQQLTITPPTTAAAVPSRQQQQQPRNNGKDTRAHAAHEVLHVNTPQALLRYQATVHIVYDKISRSQLLYIPARTTVSFLRTNNSNTSAMTTTAAARHVVGAGVHAPQRVLVLQLRCERTAAQATSAALTRHTTADRTTPSCASCALRVVLSLRDGYGVRRVVLSSAVSRAHATSPQHALVPLRCLRYGQWLQLVVDVASLYRTFFVASHAADEVACGRVPPYRLQQLEVSSELDVYVRRVVAMPEVPSCLAAVVDSAHLPRCVKDDVADDDSSDGEGGVRLLLCALTQSCPPLHMCASAPAARVLCIRTGHEPELVMSPPPPPPLEIQACMTADDGGRHADADAAALAAMSTTSCEPHYGVDDTTATRYTRTISSDNNTSSNSSAPSVASAAADVADAAAMSTASSSAGASHSHDAHTSSTSSLSTSSLLLLPSSAAAHGGSGVVYSAAELLAVVQQRVQRIARVLDATAPCVHHTHAATTTATRQGPHVTVDVAAAATTAAAATAACADKAVQTHTTATTTAAAASASLSPSTAAAAAVAVMPWAPHSTDASLRPLLPLTARPLCDTTRKLAHDKDDDTPTSSSSSSSKNSNSNGTLVTEATAAQLLEQWRRREQPLRSPPRHDHVHTARPYSSSSSSGGRQSSRNATQNVWREQIRHSAPHASTNDDDDNKSKSTRAVVAATLRKDRMTSRRVSSMNDKDVRVVASGAAAVAATTTTTRSTTHTTLPPTPFASHTQRTQTNSSSRSSDSHRHSDAASSWTFHSDSTPLADTHSSSSSHNSSNDDADGSVVCVRSAHVDDAAAAASATRAQCQNGGATARRLIILATPRQQRTTTAMTTTAKAGTAQGACVLPPRPQQQQQHATVSPRTRMGCVYDENCAALPTQQQQSPSPSTLLLQLSPSASSTYSHARRVSPRAAVCYITPRNNAASDSHSVRAAAAGHVSATAADDADDAVPSLASSFVCLPLSQLPASALRCGRYDALTHTTTTTATTTASTASTRTATTATAMTTRTTPQTPQHGTRARAHATTTSMTRTTKTTQHVAVPSSSSSSSSSLSRTLLYDPVLQCYLDLHRNCLVLQHEATM